MGGAVEGEACSVPWTDCGAPSSGFTQINSRSLNRVGEWNNLNLNYRINIFCKTLSSFERRRWIL